MSTRRLGVGVAVLATYLYAVGGSDGTSPLNTGLYAVVRDGWLYTVLEGGLKSLPGLELLKFWTLLL